MKQRTKYAIAAVATLFVGYHTIFCNNFPEWYWLFICLSSIFGTFCFGIAEKAYKLTPNATFKAYPITSIFSGITCVSGILAAIQIVLIVRADLGY